MHSGLRGTSTRDQARAYVIEVAISSMTKLQNCTDAVRLVENPYDRQEVELIFGG